MVEGGSERAISVSHGIQLIDQEQSGVVLIHDAARPGLTAKVIDSLLTALETYDGAAPALPVSDSLKRMEGDSIGSVARDNLYRIQTPQAFRKACLLDMYSGNISAYSLDTALENFHEHQDIIVNILIAGISFSSTCVPGLILDKFHSSNKW